MCVIAFNISLTDDIFYVFVETTESNKIKSHVHRAYNISNKKPAADLRVRTVFKKTCEIARV